MSEVIFRHKEIPSLMIPIRPNGISWAYKLNTANHHTYGGEVVQILSCYIDNMIVEGNIKTYEKAEEIYEFFARYFTIATQGREADAEGVEKRFEQNPCIMEYPEREWTFHIQPLKAPGFRYSREMVAPVWRLQAHIIDQSIYNKELKEYVEQALAHISNLGGTLQLSGELSPISGDPAQNPFIAPLVPKISDQAVAGKELEFSPLSAEEVMQDEKRFASFYTSQIPSYLKGEFTDLTQIAASSPVFGKPGAAGAAQQERAAEKKEESKITGGKK